MKVDIDDDDEDYRKILSVESYIGLSEIWKVIRAG